MVVFRCEQTKLVSIHDCIQHNASLGMVIALKTASGIKRDPFNAY
jgi:hypothetical protein